MAMTEADARHFLGRVGFSPDQADVEYCIGREIDAVVDDLLSAERLAPTQPAYLESDPAYVANQKTLDWWLNRMIDSRWVTGDAATPHPLVEKMTMFWHGHFATAFETVNDATLMWEQNQILRLGALGDFEQLCTDISIHGAMLIYLDNESNVAGGVQENFARELMELFTMGIGHYTEFDVVEMARAWTGHGTVGWVPETQSYDGTYEFHPDKHDNDDKTIFGLTANWDGPDTIAEICQGARQVETARFLTTKLWRYFISGSAPAAAVNELASVFVAAGMNIKELMRALLKRPEFWAASNRRALVKNPSQYVVDFYRCVGLRFVDQQSTWFMRRMGQELFAPPNVAGWGVNGYWLSTATMWGRARFASDRRWVVVNEFGFLSELLEMDPVTGTNHLLEAFRIHEPSAATENAVLSWFEKTKASTEWALAPVGISVAALTPEFQVI